PGVELIPLVDAEQCCGSAGIFNLTHTELSMKVLTPKIAHIKESGADTVVTTNPGCLMQLEAGIKEAGLTVKAVHLAELLDQAYCAE
ncbi:MAG: (Fe-S)-binding protein, partial [Candidatus Obscuribacterales bacterium]|nr:(Fe-S)-binding protein [Candidatus Obscuribacterales bacterium]